jgi:hypothetical protein
MDGCNGALDCDQNILGGVSGTAVKTDAEPMEKALVEKNVNGNNDV